MIALSKGGALLAGSVRADRPVLWDAGWQATDDHGTVWASSWPGSSRVFALTLEPAGLTSVEIDGPFHRVDYSRPLERWLVPFRLLSKALADVEPIMGPFSRWLKGPRILESPEGPLRLRRIVNLERGELTIVDRLTTDVHPVTRLRWGGPFTARFAPTAKIYSPGELVAVEAPQELLTRAAQLLTDRQEVRVIMKLTVDANGVPRREFLGAD
jgi:hypothetical protein